MDECLCERCGNGMSVNLSLPDPETGKGDLCPSCYEDARHEYDVREGEDWLAARIPSMDRFLGIYAKHLGISKKTVCLENNCHVAATALVNHLKRKKLAKARVKRGHWLGRDIREKRKDQIARQHSWVEVEVPDNPIHFLLDPTQFVFTGAEPHIALSTEEDRRYDPGGYNLREVLLGKRQMPARSGPIKASGLSKGAQEAISKLYGRRNWGKWTREEMNAVANTNPANLNGYARELFSAILKSGNRALIPIDARLEILGS